MKKIEAWQAEDGTLFSTEHECDNHEWVKEAEAFEAWYAEHTIGTRFADTTEVYRWLQKNAEDIRGLLSPAAAKPELDIEVLRSESRWSNLENDTIVPISTVARWLAGEL